MAISAKLELRQGQQLVMTPQLQQAIRLLQLSNLELTAYVDAELERPAELGRLDHRDGAAGLRPGVGACGGPTGQHAEKDAEAGSVHAPTLGHPVVDG